MATTWRQNEQGVLEEIDEDGNIVSVEKLKELPRNCRQMITTKDRYGNEIQVPGRWKFSRALVREIAKRKAKGEKLHQILNGKDLPSYSTFNRWARKYEVVGQILDEYRTMQADIYAEKAIQAAEEATENTSKAQRLKMDAYIWGAEVTNREKYGKQTKVSGDPNSPLGFIVVTGVPDPEPIDVKAEQIEESK